jgi:hypothetical protein
VKDDDYASFALNAAIRQSFLEKNGTHLMLEMIAKDEAQIIKVANEKRIQLLAEKRWWPGESI